MRRQCLLLLSFLIVLFVLGPAAGLSAEEQGQQETQKQQSARRQARGNVFPVHPALTQQPSRAASSTKVRSEVEARSSDEDEGTTVLKALTNVFITFGNLATSLLKINFVPDIEEGRGKMGKMAIPLIIGFKISGVIVAAIAALKVLIMKTIAFSSLALLASAGVAAKYVYDKTQHKHAEGAQQVTPYYYAPVQDLGWDASSYNVQSTGLDAAIQQPADLQGHYSSNVLQTSSPLNQTNYSFIPAVPVAQRKILQGASPYKATVYRTIYRTD